MRWSIALGSPPCPRFPRRVVQLLVLPKLLRHFRTVLLQMRFRFSCPSAESRWLIRGVLLVIPS